MASRTIFRVKSPLGYTVVLTRNRWRQIVRFKHPALEGHEQLVRQCVRRPELVRESAKDPQVHLYYITARRGHLCAVIGPGDNEQRFVVTAYFTRQIKKGKELWTK